MAFVCVSKIGVVQFSMIIGFAGLILASATLATDMPEPILVLASLIYYLISRSHWKGAKQRLMDSSAAFSLPWLFVSILLGVTLIAAAINGFPQIGFAMLGIIAYFVLHAVGACRQKSSQLKCKMPPPAPAATTQTTTNRHAIVAKAASLEQSKRHVAGEKQRKPSAVQAQVARPQVTGLDAEVHDIVRTGSPTAADDLVVRQIINHVRQSIVPVVPEAEVFGCATCNLAHLGAQGLKPEVDIVVMANPEVLTERLKAWFLQAPTSQRTQKSMATLLPDALQKTATRVLAERLTNLRFWRSQFIGPEPKIVLLVPPALGISQYPIRMNFHVNNPYPKRQSTVIVKGSTRCKELALLVTRWANARGITNTAKGHLHPYGYSLLVLYFFRKVSDGDLNEKSTFEIFGDFARFYGDWFNQSQSDAVAVRFGVGDEQHMSAESRLFGIPYIEDPFATAHNVASSMTADGVVRLKEELARASSLVSANPKNLQNLLERWSPPTGGEVVSDMKMVEES